MPCTRMFSRSLATRGRTRISKLSPTDTRVPRTATAAMASSSSRRGLSPVVSRSTITKRPGTAPAPPLDDGHRTGNSGMGRPRSARMVQAQALLQQARLAQRLPENAPVEPAEPARIDPVRIVGLAQVHRLLGAQPQALQELEGVDPVRRLRLG